MNDDDTLITGVATGDDMALRKLYSRHVSWLTARLSPGAPLSLGRDGGGGPPDVDLGRVWTEIAAQVWRPIPGGRSDW